jgi:hypothetical protein
MNSSSNISPGWISLSDVKHFGHGLLSVVIHKFDSVRTVGLPDKANPPLVVDTDAVLALAIPLQCLQPVPGRNAQRLQSGGGVQL